MAIQQTVTYRNPKVRIDANTMCIGLVAIVQLSNVTQLNVSKEDRTPWGIGGAFSFFGAIILFFLGTSLLQHFGVVIITAILLIFGVLAVMFSIFCFCWLLSAKAHLQIELNSGTTIRLSSLKKEFLANAMMQMLDCMNNGTGDVIMDFSNCYITNSNLYSPNSTVAQGSNIASPNSTTCYNQQIQSINWPAVLTELTVLRGKTQSPVFHIFANEAEVAAKENNWEKFKAAAKRIGELGLETLEKIAVPVLVALTKLALGLG